VGLVVNGQRTFFVAYCVGMKKASSPYRVGKKVLELALQVRTHNGVRMTGIDTLSNQPPSDAELDGLRMPLDSAEVRKKIGKLQSSMQEFGERFNQEELRMQAEASDRLQSAQAQAARAEAAASEDRERKEREREEVRQRAAQKSAMSGDQWWLSFQTKSGGKAREKAKLQSRLSRFQKIAQSSELAAERANAQRLAEQAQAKLASLDEQPEDEDQ